MKKKIAIVVTTLICFAATTISHSTNLQDQIDKVIASNFTQIAINKAQLSKAKVTDLIKQYMTAKHNLKALGIKIDMLKWWQYAEKRKVKKAATKNIKKIKKLEKKYPWLKQLMQNAKNHLGVAI